MQLGHECPEHYNPAEFVADLISIDFTTPDTEADTRSRVGDLIAAWRSSQGATTAAAAATTGKSAQLAVAEQVADDAPSCSWFRYDV